MPADDLEALAEARDAGKPQGCGYNPLPPGESDRIGVHGEALCARLFGLPLNRKIGNDGGADFAFIVRGRRVTIDVKTHAIPAHLLVMQSRIRHCADILVLCGYHEARGAWFVGWECRAVLTLSRPLAFKPGGPLNYWRRADRLRTLGELVELIAERDDDSK